MGPAIGKGNGSVEPVSQEIWEGLVGGESGPPSSVEWTPFQKKNLQSQNWPIFSLVQAWVQVFGFWGQPLGVWLFFYQRFSDVLIFFFR